MYFSQIYIVHTTLHEEQTQTTHRHYSHATEICSHYMVCVSVCDSHTASQLDSYAKNNKKPV